MIFQCDKCLKYFSYKTNYLNHLRRKIPCKINISNNIDQIDKPKIETSETATSGSHDVADRLRQRSQMTTSKKLDIDFTNSKENGFKCKLCGIIYKYSQSLSSHKRKKHPNYEYEIINIKNKEISELDNIKEIFIKHESDKDKKIEKLMKDLDDKNKQMETIIKTSKAKTIYNNITNNNVTNNNTTKNTNNGIINNVTIVGFGKEEYSKLNGEEIYKILCDINRDPLTTSIEMFHFNDRLPQYKNIKLKDIKSKYIDVHNGSKWQKQSKSNIIDV
jgi:hypothetical protein